MAKQKKRKFDQSLLDQEAVRPRRKSALNRMKRKAAENGFSRISLALMFPVYFGIAVFMIVGQRPEESQIEKRKLESFPDIRFETLFSGEFTANITKWYDDTVPERDRFKEIGNEFENYFGIKNDDSVKFVGQPEVVTKPKPEKPKINENSKSENSQTSQVSQEESTQKDYTQEEAEYRVENGIIVVKQDGHYRALELFGGGTGKTYTDALNNFQKDLGDSVRIYSMTAPLASEYYTPANYSDRTASQKDCFDNMAQRLNEKITFVDITDVLKKHTQEAIYFRTDHHWTGLGAYYAAQTFAKAAGVDFKDISTFTPNTVKDFVGTMYAFTGDADLNKDREDFTYYIPDNYAQCEADFYTTDFDYRYSGELFVDVQDPQHNAYMIYMGGDEQIVKLRTNIKNGRRLLIVKDSYGNALPGFLTNSFEEIYVIDMRYFEHNLVNFAKQMKITDMLFAMVTYSAVGDNADNLEVLRTQYPKKLIIDKAPSYSRKEE